tara:strand:- start:443 stop:1117 length:675 start_codon:yes stop_codon:yes gene_type:complete
MKNKIYSAFHLSFIEKIILKKRIEMKKKIEENINFENIDSICDVGTTEDISNKSSNFLIKSFTNIKTKNSITDQLIEDDFFKNKVQASITSDLQSAQVDQLKSDICFSSATIEHVGCRNNQKKMVENMINLSKKYIIITTPNKFYPIEFHTKLPLLHFLPKIIYKSILKLTGYSYFAKIENLNPLSINDLSKILKMFSNIKFKIIKIKLFGFTSNLVAICEKNN